MAAPAPLVLDLPFTGRWLVQNSPARRVPSHGTDAFGERYAIDFVGVDGRGRTAATRSWRTVLATEPPDLFVGFGRPILAPVSGIVAVVHDGEEDHAARRSQLALVPYVLGQARRLRAGVNAIAGNHVVLECADGFVALVHLQRGSLEVQAGQRVAAGEQVARCGSSGNSTQPHVHVQAMDSLDLSTARGLPITFRDFREARGHSEPVLRSQGLPDDGSVVEPAQS